MSKKIISLLLAVMLTVSMIAVAAVSVSAEEAAHTYIVAGNVEVFGSTWDGTDVDNVMTDEDGDGVYELTITDVEAGIVQFKIVADGETWIGKATDGTATTDGLAGNFIFEVTDDCDVTITYDPSANAVTYSGEFVTEYVFSLDELYVVGTFNGWIPADEDCAMTEVEPGIWQFVLEEEEGTSSFEFKFVCDSGWATQWGGTGAFVELDTVTDAVKGSNPANIIVAFGDEDKLYDLTFTFDVTNFDPDTGDGATFMVSAALSEDDDEPATTTPVEDDTTVPVEDDTTVPVEDDTTAPVEDDTTVPATDDDTTSGAPLTVNATSNFFTNVVAEYNAETNQVTVSYYLTSDKGILNFQIGTKDVDSTVLDGITYDPEVLQVSSDWTNKKTLPLTGTGGCAVNLKGVEGSIKLNGSSLDLYDANDPDTPFIQITFDVLDLTGKGNVTTTIDCEVESIRVADYDDDNQQPINEEYLIVNKVADLDAMASNNVSAITTLTPSTYEETTTEPVETTAPADDETTAPADDETEPAVGNKITANSNLLPTDEYDAVVGETVSVDYYLTADVLDTQWQLVYDPTVLELVTTTDFMPQITSGADYNVTEGLVEGSASNLDLYNVTADAPFVSAQFKKIAEGDTTVTLVVSVLKTAELNEDGTINEDTETYVVFNGQVAEEITTATDFDTVISAVADDTTTEPEETTTEPEETTTPAEDETTTPVEDETTEPAEEETTAAAEDEETTAADEEVPTTVAGASSSTADTATSDTTSTSTGTTSNGTVQTGDASMAIIILSVLIAGTVVMFVLRKKEMF